MVSPRNERMNHPSSENIAQFLQLAGKLKTTFRSIAITPDRKESTADHSWRLALLVILAAPFLDQKINVEKALKMAVIHDLGESIAGDTDIQDLIKNETLQKEKIYQEHQAFIRFRHLLGDVLGGELLDLWLEFEKQISYEAKLIQALDKLEAQFQQNESQLSTWKELQKLGKLKEFESMCDFDSFIRKLKETANAKRVHGI
jgi:putative hydrolases of HD superfamily